MTGIFKDTSHLRKIYLSTTKEIPISTQYLCNCNHLLYW